MYYIDADADADDVYFFKSWSLACSPVLKEQTGGVMLGGRIHIND